MGVVVSSETICQALKTNADAILNNLQDRVQSERFFISYDNMNFYERVRDQRLHNRARMLSYTAGYVCFMKASDGSPMPHLTSDDIDYSAVNKLSAEDILLSPSGEQYQSEAMRYILSITLEKHFGKAMRNQKKKARIKGMNERVPLYQKWPAPLRTQRCALLKADVVPLPTFPLNKANIEDNIDILRNLLARLQLAEVVEGNVVMLKGDWLTVRNVTRAIYRKQGDKPGPYRFNWIEPIAGFFHLQMNVLTILHTSFWGAPGDLYSLQRFNAVLKHRQGVGLDIKKYFHANDEFFRMIIHAHVIALCMHRCRVKKFEDFDTFLACNNWPALLKEVEKEYLAPSKVAGLRQGGGEDSAAEVAKRLLVRKHEFEVECIDAQAVGRRRKRMPNWAVVEAEIQKEVIDLRRDKVYENALLVMRCGLAYLDFVDACRGGYGARAQKCIEYFAILFQGSNATNYARETIHLVACFKHIWKPNFLYVFPESSTFNKAYI